ncbi:MAG: hypothetical protein IT220_08855 [Flavobacteriaceae bacterium]|nr:hypothetical protein [Flavobacteriaceae bacterium]
MKLAFIFFFTFTTFNLIAQDFIIPNNYKLETEIDYLNLEGDVVKAVDWIIENPIDEEMEKRTKTYYFIFGWVNKNPYFIFDTTNEIATFMDSPDCIAVFIGGMAKYSIENKDYSNKYNKNLAGVKAVIEFYKKNVKYFKNNRYLKTTKKSIENYIELQESNKLEKFINDNI